MTKKKIYRPIIDRDIGTLVHAGQDFVAGHAWITIPLYGECEDDDNEPLVAFYLDDDGKIFYADEKVDGLRFMDVVYPEERWMHQDLLGWLNGGKNSPTLKELVEEVASVFAKYAEYAHSFEPKFFALWSIATYFHQLFDSFPMIFLTGFKETGKSRTGKVVSFISFNGCLSPNISTAVMFRQIDEEKCTLIIDEKEGFGESAKEMKDKDMESVMNGGDKKGALVERCELDLATKKMRPRKFEIYSPKMICNVAGSIASETMRSRCITVTMQKALHKVIIGEPDGRSPEFPKVRCGLYRYMMAHWKDVQKAYNESDFEGNRRAITIWKPLVVMAGMVDEDLKKELFAYMELRLEDTTFDEEETDEVKLLFRLHDVITEKRYYTLKEISGIMPEQDLRWQDYNDRKLGGMLKRLGFRDKKHTNQGARYMLSPEKVDFEMKRFGIGAIKEVDAKSDEHTPPVLVVTTSLSSQSSHDGDVSDGSDKVTTKTIPLESSLRPPDQTSLGEVQNDNNGTSEPSICFPEKVWNEIGKCSSCGVTNMTTMHNGVEICKLCYFELKSDELDEGEKIDGSINPSNDSKEEQGG
jgi:hypothetical protein